MLEAALTMLDEHIANLAYVALVLVLAITAFHADHRFTEERNRNEGLERRIRSLTLVIRFQQTLVDAKLPETEPDHDRVEVLDLSVDHLISKMGYCLTCHRLKAPTHFAETDHLQLEDPHISGVKTEGH